MCTIYGVLLHFVLFFAKSVFYAINAVLSQNQFCWDSRAFVWRKFEPKIVPVEKNDKYEVLQ